MKRRKQTKRDSTIQHAAMKPAANVQAGDAYGDDDWDDDDWGGIPCGCPGACRRFGSERVRCHIVPDDPIADILGLMLMQAVLIHAAKKNPIPQE